MTSRHRIKILSSLTKSAGNYESKVDGIHGSHRLSGWSGPASGGKGLNPRLGKRLHLKVDPA